MCRRSAATTYQLDSGPRWQQTLSVHSMIALCCPEPITRGRRCGRDAPLPPFLDKRCSSVMPSKRDRATTTAVRGIRRRVSFRNHKALSDANGSTSAGRSAPVPAAAAPPRAGVQRRPLARDALRDLLRLILAPPLLLTFRPLRYRDRSCGLAFDACVTICGRICRSLPVIPYQLAMGLKPYV